MQEVKSCFGQANEFMIREVQVNNNGKIDLSILLKDLIIYADPPQLISDMRIEVSLCSKDARELRRKLKEASRIGTTILQRTEATCKMNS